MEFERLGAFYLGRERGDGGATDRPVVYDARDLTTHAVCIGMTGSGKTGLCIDLLEEAALDRVPALILDPKGDMTNLLLTFPELRPEDFRPWVNPDDARRAGLELDAFASAEAEKWRKGLADWGQGGARIGALREAADFRIYTPGSEAGIPVSVLSSLRAPGGDWETDAEALRDRVAGTVGGLLALVGLEADPVRSREHILLANLFEHYWRRGEDLDLARLILSVQDPPIRRLGVFDVDTFFPERERSEFAGLLNNLAASPDFRAWLAGAPMDVPRFLSAPDGRPRHSIFYLAHLSDAERMFFVTLLLEQVIAWMRSQPGTTSLRALLYMDEVFGFLPPVAEPPSKRAFLTLLKQARAFGLGLVLTTQNPVDLDYKALSNAGTWFLGRLQTERDKLRVLDGLEAAAAGAGPDREALGSLLSGLGKRRFLLHNVHEGAPPLTFETRWAMSYLRGPLTRTQVKELAAAEGMVAEAEATSPAPGVAGVAAPTTGSGARGGPLDGRAPETAVGSEPLGPEVRPTAARTAAETAGESALAPSPPVLDREIRQVHLGARRGAAAAAVDAEARRAGPVTVRKSRLVYVPHLLGSARVHFLHRKSDTEASRDVALLARPGTDGLVRWGEARPVDPAVAREDAEPNPEGGYAPVPKGMNEPDEVRRAEKDLADHLYRSQRLVLLHSPALEAWSAPGETAEAFRLRLAHEARERRDAEVDEVERAHAERLDRLEERLRRTEATVAKREAEASARTRETLVSVGESLVGLFLGRRSTRAASSSLSRYRMGASARARAEEAREDAEALREEMESLESELRREVEGLAARWEASALELEEVSVSPRRADVDVAGVSVAWVPAWRLTYDAADGSGRTEDVPAL